MCNARGRLRRLQKKDVKKLDMSLMCVGLCLFVCVCACVEEESVESSKLYFPCEAPFVFIFPVEKIKKKKDTASKLRSESRRPRFSARGQKPLRMVDMGSHDAQSAGKSRIYIRPPVS